MALESYELTIIARWGAFAPRPSHDLARFLCLMGTVATSLLSVWVAL